MKQIFLNSGTYTYKPLKGKLDMEKYILSVLAKDTCCAKSLFADIATITTLTATTFNATAFTSTTLGVTGALSLANGTVALPSLAFTSDPDTGLYRIGANNIGVSANGAKVLDVSTTGLGVVGTVLSGDGLVGTPAHSFTSDPDTGLYHIAANQIGIATNGVLVGFWNTVGLGVGSIQEQVTGSGIQVKQNLIRKHTTFAVNTTATVAAADLIKGYLTSTSAAAVTATLDTATAIGTAIGAVAGTTFDFYVDNTSGANTVTVAVGSGITAATPVITGGGTLTVSVANAIGIFRLVFSSATVAKLYRLG